MQRELTFEPDLGAVWASPPQILVIAGHSEGRDEALSVVDERLGVPARRLIGRRETVDKPGALTLVDVDHDEVHQVGWLSLGGNADDYRAAGATLATSVLKNAALVRSDQITGGTGVAVEDVAGLLQAWQLAGYRYSLKSVPPKVEPGGLIAIGEQSAFAAHQSLTDAALIARDLANTPSNIKSPQWLADQVRQRCRAHGLVVTVRDENYLTREGFGGITAVGGGSERPPRFVEVKSRGRRGAPRVVLVGKGVTYDSGGLSLKPADSMALMKTDMAGAAAVAGAMAAYAAEPGRNGDAEVVALLPLAENMPSGSSYRPGDIIRHFGGLTTEVSNTDAEGRLLLADSLAYARERLAPDVVVDIATLTGAATLGLSRHYAALYSDDPTLVGQLVAAGHVTGDQLWQLPLVESYRGSLDTPIADIAQATTDPKVRAGSIMAALYLQRFVGDMVWAHIDMAGPARADKPRGEHPVGATGFGARLLAQWLRTADLSAFTAKSAS